MAAVSCCEFVASSSCMLAWCNHTVCVTVTAQGVLAPCKHTHCSSCFSRVVCAGAVRLCLHILLDQSRLRKHG